MIRTIDKHITGLYQALVNASGKKPMWWGEQCAYLLLLGLCLGAMRTDFPGPLWLRLVILCGLVLLAAFMWFGSRWAPGWEHNKEANTLPWRMVWLTLFCMDVWAIFFGVPRVNALCVSLAFCSFHYFLTCEDPPPPKPRTRTKLAGNH